MAIKIKVTGVVQRACGVCGAEREFTVTDRWRTVGPFGLAQARDGRERSVACSGCGLSYVLPAPRKRTLKVLHA